MHSHWVEETLKTVLTENTMTSSWTKKEVTSQAAAEFGEEHSHLFFSLFFFLNESTHLNSFHMKTDLQSCSLNKASVQLLSLCSGPGIKNAFPWKDYIPKTKQAGCTPRSKVTKQQPLVAMVALWTRATLLPRTGGQVSMNDKKALLSPC